MSQTLCHLCSFSRRAFSRDVKRCFANKQHRGTFSIRVLASDSDDDDYHHHGEILQRVFSQKFISDEEDVQLSSSSSSSVKARRGNAAVVSTSVADADSFGAQQQHQRRRRRRESVDAISRELDTVYSLVESNGRGAIYLGSSRIKEGHDVFERSKQLATSVALLLECTTWSGIGPGLMDAVTLGGLEANGKASGILILMGEKEEQTGKITRQKTRKHPYLKESQYCACSFFSARKHGLVDAGVRDGKESTKTAFFCLPGGIGTLDEFAEILTLFQLRRIGSEEKVPFVLMNYDGVFDKLLEFITESCVEHGLVNRGEMEEHLKVCSTNEEALAYLKEFYAL